MVKSIIIQLFIIISLCLIVIVGCIIKNCSKRTSWEPIDREHIDTTGLFVNITLLDEDNLSINHVLLETEVEPVESTTYILNKSSYPIIFKKIELIYIIEGSVVELKKQIMMNSSRNIIQSFERNEFFKQQGDFHLINPNETLEIKYLYDFVDSEEYKKGKLQLNITYEIEEEIKHFDASIDLYKYKIFYNCILGNGKPKKRVGAEIGSHQAE